MVWPAIIAAVGSAVAADKAGRASDKAAQQGAQSASDAAALNANLQREFASHGIRWKVDDAKAAGLHPLAALGASTIGASPVAIGYTPSPDYSKSNFINEMGQNISRAVHATRTARERQAEYAAAQQRQREMDTITLERHKADLQHASLRNALLASELKRLETQNNPPMPDVLTSKEPQPGLIRVEPSRATSHDRNVKSLEAATTPGMKRYRVGGPNTGGIVELPSEQMSQALDSLGPLAPFYVWGHNVSRAVDRFWSGGKKPSVTSPGTDWRWNRWRQEWEAYRVK